MVTIFSPADAPTLGGAAFDINNSGMLVGEYSRIDPDRTRRRAFASTAPPDSFELPFARHTFSSATAINDAGQIACYGGRTPSVFSAFRYDPDLGMQDLGNFGGATETTGMNASGQVVGFSETSSGLPFAFRYTDGVGLENLGTLTGFASVAHGINDLGWVTGVSDGRTIFLYRDGIGMIGLGDGIGYAINNLGVIAGTAEITPDVFRAFVTSNETVRFIDTLGGPSGVFDINNRGVAVGYTVVGSVQKAFIWTDREGMLDLNSLIPADSGWILGSANSINDLGQITGYGRFAGEAVAFRLDPILPRLRIQISNSMALISWTPAWPNILLESRSSLSEAWKPLATPATNYVSLAVTNSQHFFRLTSQ